MNSKQIAAIAWMVLIIGGALYLFYRYFSPQINNVLKTPNQTACTLEAKICPDGSAVGRTGPKCEFAPCPTSNLPTITTPKADSKVTSPLTIKGIVPAGWMFEGVFPIKLIDSSGNIIAQGQAKEVTPGSWQSGNPVNFTATLTFSTTVKSGFIVLMNDNPSGDPSKAQTFKEAVTF